MAIDTPVKEKVDLLYGKEKDWVFEPEKSKNSDSYDAYKFVLLHNKLGQKPLFGDEGFGPGFRTAHQAKKGRANRHGLLSCSALTKRWCNS